MDLKTLRVLATGVAPTLRPVLLYVLDWMRATERRLDVLERAPGASPTTTKGNTP